MAVITNVLELNAGKSPQTLQELKQSIKNLKNELIGLEQGTDEYNETLLKTGELTHQLREIQEQISRTTGDYGDNLSQLNNTLAGGVASITAVTSSLSLMGVELGDDAKLMKTLVSAMSLTQALSSIDKAQKGFKALTITIKGSINAAGGLGKALKSLAVSNPFTAILAAATAVIAVFAKIAQKNREAAEQMAEDQKNAAEQARESWEKSFQEIQNYLQRLQRTSLDNSDFWNYDEFQKIMKATTASGKTDLDISKAAENSAKARAALKGDAKYFENGAKIYKEAYDNLNSLLAIHWRDMQDSYDKGKIDQDQYFKMMKELQDQFGANKKMYQSYLEDRNAYQVKKNEEFARKRQEQLDKRSKEEKDAYEKLKKGQDDYYNHEKSLLKQELDDIIAQEEQIYQTRVENANGDEVDILDAEVKKNEKLYQANQSYYTKLLTLTENYKKEVENRVDDNTSLVDNLNESIQEITKNVFDGQVAWRAYSKTTVESLKEIQKEKAQAQLDKDSLNNESELLKEQIELRKGYYDEYLNLLKSNKSEFDLRGAELDNQKQLLEIQKQGYDFQEQQLQFSLDNKLISLEEFNNASLQLEYDRLELMNEINELEVEQEKNKLDKKKDLQQKYVDAVGVISGSIVNVLNGLADAEGVSFERSKQIKVAAATISTIQGALDAFMSCQGSYPQPYGAILGAVQAAAVTATGMLEIQKIKSTTKNSNGSVSAPAPATIIESAPTNTTISGFDDDIELPDTKVYVVESDITDAQRRVRVQEHNAQF